jgi:molybdopterin synthase sulfur carrier subunit
VKVHFYATLRAAVGTKTVDFALRDGGTVGELVDEIIARYPELGPKLLAADGTLARGVHVFVNGRGAGFLPEGLGTCVQCNDTVDVFPAVAGG